MEVTLGCYGMVLAFLSVFFGMAEVGLWVACYFECTDGQLIAFNYFAAVWTGVLAFTVGFMIVVLFCVKFKSLGTFIIILTFLLVPCEIICACIYAYRAYLSRPMGDALTGNVGVDYFDVFLFSAMSVCGVCLFLITITWNCYYCCIATPEEDYEEEVKEDLDEEDERQQHLQTVQDSVFVNNPVVDDDSRPNQTRPLTFGPPRARQDPGQGRFPQAVQNGNPRSTQPRQNGNSRYPVPTSDNRRDNRSSRYPQSGPDIRNDFAYPSAFNNREAVPEDRNRRNRQQSQMPRSHVGANHQSYMRNENGRGQVNSAYEPDEFGQPVDRSYNLRSYIYDGAQGDSYEQPIHQGGQQVQPEQSRRVPNHYYSSTVTDNSRSNNESRRHVNRPSNIYAQRSSRDPAPSSLPRDEDRSYIYQPRPDNFRGKPSEPVYMQHQQQQQRTAPNSSYSLQASAQNPASRPREVDPSSQGSGGPVDSYF